jgi:F420H(2)-dependent quinone reductase
MQVSTVRVSLEESADVSHGADRLSISLLHNLFLPTIDTMANDEHVPEIPRAGVDLPTLPDASWIYGQNEALAKLDRSGTTKSLTLDLDGEGKRVIVVTVRGVRTGRPRRIPLMRVHNDGCYAAIASKGGSAKPPAWYHNLKANPEVQLQDLTTIGDFTARELLGEERALWWDRAVQAFRPYAGYAERAGRLIPVFLLEPVADGVTRER